MFEGLYNAILQGIFQKGPANWTAFHLAKVLLTMPQDKIGNNIDHLDPNLRPLADELLRQFPRIKIISVLRSNAEQNRLYRQGRSEPGAVVTNARGGESYHNYGLAFDFMFKDDLNFTSPRSQYEVVGRAGEKLGMIWGGAFDDIGHFEFHQGFTWEKLKKYFI